MIGQTLSHYKVPEELSRRGMEIGYLNLNRDVALKGPLPELIAASHRGS